MTKLQDLVKWRIWLYNFRYSRLQEDEKDRRLESKLKELDKQIKELRNRNKCKRVKELENNGNK